MNHGQLYAMSTVASVRIAMRYRKHAENSEDTYESVDGLDSWNPPKLADRFAQAKCDRLPSNLKEGDLLESHFKTPESQAYVRAKRRSKDGSPTCSP
jgi:hypothetical protein